MLTAECSSPSLFNTLPTIHCPIHPLNPHFSPFVGIFVPYALPLNRILNNEPAGELYPELSGVKVKTNRFLVGT
jgi:hypothetical protein